ncbi:hypothetical protein PRZ48_000690 [Zasmidium cellare]|uniref:Arginyl-tRNA--protein transferase 1 n=1 Tax=Zasmidium cellare TaxID=395010 RepID=A0ABR0EZH2_ZASCE|nr:hypothetical protein PRZ48_000690 [Zasmidium cellare]
MRAKALSPDHYQELMDRGWRRSGTLLYLPDASRSCCPHYTIRLPAADFKPSRDQRQALNRWNRYVLGEKYIKEVEKKFPKTKEEKKRLNNSFDLLSTVHESEESNLKPDITPEHTLSVTIEPDRFTEEKFALFDNYQRHVHHEGDGDVSRPGFKRFLCGSPLLRRTDSTGKRLGSYHQCYRVDGRLIAMAVLDLLPHAVSGVYFIYHSDFEKWSFGKLSALREAALAHEQGYQYYYMGYYIHSCKKMRYKGDYKQQYVLDYDSLAWDPLDDEMKTLMDTRKYASMSQERKRQSLQQAVEAAESEHDAEDAAVRKAKSALKAFEKAQEPLHPSSLEAMKSGLSLLQLGMPGTLSLDEVKDLVDLDSMRVRIGGGHITEMRNIATWTSGSELEPRSLKGIFAEFAAAVGPVIAKEGILDFS